MKKEMLLYTDEPGVYFGSYGEFYDTYKNECLEMGIEFDESDAYEWFSNNVCDYQAENLWQIIDRVNDGTFLLSGSAGLWHGRVPGGYLSHDLKDLILKAINKMDYITIKLDDGLIRIEAVHHDGTNLWSIRRLNDGADKVIEKWEEFLAPHELHEKLADDCYWDKFRGEEFIF